MQSRDNLKKLVFRFCPFPGMAGLESAWSQAAELAADDAAVSNLNDAVDLAAALVKFPAWFLWRPLRFVPWASLPDPSARAWRACLLGMKPGKAPTTRIRPWYAVAPVLVALLCVVAYLRPGSGADSRSYRVARPLAMFGDAAELIPSSPTSF